MKLAVIGSGNIGKAIGSWAAKVGYEVTFSAKNEDGAKAAAQVSGHSAKAANVRGAVETADLVLLAVPYGAVKEVVTEIRHLLRGKTVIDATNALSADFSSLTLGFTTSAAEEIAKTCAPGPRREGIQHQLCAGLCVSEPKDSRQSHLGICCRRQHRGQGKGAGTHYQDGV